MHLLHIPLVICLGGACFIETSSPTDVQHFINTYIDSLTPAGTVCTVMMLLV